MTRRHALKLLGAAGAVAAGPLRIGASPTPAPGVGRERVARYLATLVRDDGGYAWGDQEFSHLTPTFAAIGALRLLGLEPRNRAALAQFVRTHHPREIKKLEQERRIFEWQQLQALGWLGADVGEFREKIAGLTRPMSYLKQYEQHGYPIFQSELGTVQCHALLGLPLAQVAPAFLPYIEERRRANGSFNNTPARDGGDGHVMNTLWALEALRTLGEPRPATESLVAWLRGCQLSNGGFTYQPQPMFAGVDDVAYTRAALRALRLLGAAPADRGSAVAYLHSLANPDGGFGDRPGWASNASATYCALDALDALGALETLDTLDPPRRRPAAARPKLPEGLKIFSLQIEAHGHGSPADAVELARGLKLDFWGAKNATPAWLARAQALADARRVPVTFFVANEEYGTWVHVPGLGTYSHTSDIVAPAGAGIGASLAGRGVHSWPEFRTARLTPLERGGGRIVWQFGENEELVRLYLDDSLERGGYAAIGTFHFGNPDFMNTEPFLNRWRGRIPFIALQDAHGPEPWWFADMTTGFRTLFLAYEPTWDAWLHALRQNRVVAVRRDAWTKGRTWLHGGSDEAVDFVRAREADWRWWDNPAIARPLVSLVALTPADEFEVGRPQRGIALRVRCAWENTAQGGLKHPLAELVTLSLDGQATEPELIAKRRPNGLFSEYCHVLTRPDLEPGRHVAAAVVRELATKAETTHTLEFTA